jgi:hypothetical protein
MKNAGALVYVILAFAVCGVALAQDGSSSDRRFQPDWLSVPTARDYERHFPERALRRGVVGAAMLCCTPNDDASVACRVAHEWPADAGFGEAALGLAQSFRLTDASLAAYRSDPKHWMAVQMPFNLSPAQQAQSDRHLSGACNPSAPISPVSN